MEINRKFEWCPFRKGYFDEFGDKHLSFEERVYYEEQECFED